MLDQWLEERLHNRKEKGLYRSLPTGAGRLRDFTSNDYLGLAQNENLYNRIKQTVSERPLKNGSTGSRLLSGNSVHVVELERKLAGIFKSPAALLFNSGYSANLAVLSAIPQKNDTIIYDELAHASIKDGARLSLARKFSFRHNDLNDLIKKLPVNEGRNFVVVESVYSMDGDECPLGELVDLSEKHKFILILDEAHTTGVRGPQGSGMAVEKILHNKIHIRIYTFGKAMGVCGACVSGSENLIRYLVNFSRPFIYTTAPSPYQVASIGCAFDFLNANMRLQQTLKQKIRVFLHSISDVENRTKSDAAIQTFIVPGNENIRRIASQVQQQGFDVRPILSPTVPEGKERLRICLHTFNSDEEITALAKILTTVTTTSLKE